VHPLKPKEKNVNEKKGLCKRKMFLYCFFFTYLILFLGQHVQVFGAPLLDSLQQSMVYSIIDIAVWGSCSFVEFIDTVQALQLLPVFLMQLLLGVGKNVVSNKVWIFEGPLL
jgi:ABC-type polysaccharide/polyol phosphate export permease